MKTPSAGELDFGDLSGDGPLGRVIERFRIPRKTIVMALVTGAVAGGIGLGVIGQSWKEPRERDYNAILAGGVFVLTSVYFFLVTASIVRWNLWLCEHGFRSENGRSRKDFAWKGIAAVRETVTLHFADAEARRKNDPPKRVERDFRVTNARGQKVTFGTSSGLEPQPLVEALREAAKRHRIPWESCERIATADGNARSGTPPLARSG